MRTVHKFNRIHPWHIFKNKSFLQGKDRKKNTRKKKHLIRLMKIALICLCSVYRPPLALSFSFHLDRTISLHFRPNRIRSGELLLLSDFDWFKKIFKSDKWTRSTACDKEKKIQIYVYSVLRGRWIALEHSYFWSHKKVIINYCIVRH